MREKIWAFVILGIVVLAVLAFVLEKRRPKAVAPQGFQELSIQHAVEGNTSQLPKFGSPPLGASQ